jgi:hypothetical protein
VHAHRLFACLTISKHKEHKAHKGLKKDASFFANERSAKSRNIHLIQIINKHTNAGFPALGLHLT